MQWYTTVPGFYLSTSVGDQSFRGALIIMGKAADDCTRAAHNPAGDHIYILFEEAEKSILKRLLIHLSSMLLIICAVIIMYTASCIYSGTSDCALLCRYLASVPSENMGVWPDSSHLSLCHCGRN